MSLSDAKKARAEAAFKRKEDQAHDGAKAWAEYEARSRAIAENTSRLRALRLAKEAAATAQPQAENTQRPVSPITARARTKSAKLLTQAPNGPHNHPKSVT